MQLTPGTLVGSGTFNQSATRPEVGSQLISASGGRGNSTTFVLDGGLHEDPYTEVVNMVTKSGTNGFHGSLYEYVRNHKLNARNFFAATDDGLKRNQYGVSVGG